MSTDIEYDRNRTYASRGEGGKDRQDRRCAVRSIWRIHSRRVVRHTSNRGRGADEGTEGVTPPWQSTSIYGKESQDWLRVSYLYWPIAQ